MLARPIQELRFLQRLPVCACLRVQASTSAVKQPFLQPVLVSQISKRYRKPNQRGRRKYVEPAIVKHTKSSKRPVDLYENMTAKELSASLEESYDDVIDVLVSLEKSSLDLIETNKPLSKDLLLQAAAAFDCRPRFVPRPTSASQNDDDGDDLKPQPPPDPKDCEKRSPVVTIMGHVDHGKTTLLDALRNSRIVEGEFGGITQHIGAFSVDLAGSGKRVTFLDTPGHSAFAAMRERGARATDIVVLVVAADDGVKEQTVQSIKFAQDAEVPIVVAVNKIDKPGADPERAKRSLLEHNVVTEELGGDCQCVEISALYSRNLPALQEAILTQAELMDLKSTTKGLAEGIVIESSVQHGVGRVCTVLVTRGRLKRGDILVGGNSWCKVRTMTDEHGKTVTIAGPSTPVRVSGWKEELPPPGERILQASSVDRAQKCVSYRVRRDMQEKAAKDWEVIAEKREEERAAYLANRQVLLDRGQRFGSTIRAIVHRQHRYERGAAQDEFPTLRLLLRTDVEGTLEAILDVLNTYASEKCKLQIVDFGVGPPNEKDLELAKDSNAIIYTFNIAVPSKIRAQAESEGTRVENYNVIYRLVDGIKTELSSRLPLLSELELVGEGHILKEFLISDRGRKKQPIAGVLVDWGHFKKDCIYRFSRLGQAYFEGDIETLKCDKEMVAVAKTNTEVGICLTNKDVRFKEDDQVEVFEKKEIRQEIDWYPAGF